jgi:excisionase family DNA binding protein
MMWYLCPVLCLVLVAISLVLARSSDTAQGDMSGTPELLRPKEAADRLRVSVGTVRGLVNRGELQGVHVGRAVRILAESVDAFIARQTTPAACPAPAPRHAANDLEFRFLRNMAKYRQREG